MWRKLKNLLCKLSFKRDYDTLIQSEKDFSKLEWEIEELKKRVEELRYVKEKSDEALKEYKAEVTQSIYRLYDDTRYLKDKTAKNEVELRKSIRDNVNEINTKIDSISTILEPDNLIERLTTNEKFLVYINSVISNNIDLDSYSLDKKLKLATLRRGISYEDVTRIMNHMLGDVATRYLYSKYTKKDNLGYYVHNYIGGESDTNDLNEIYDLFMRTANKDLLLDDISGYFNIYDTFTKEFILSNYVYPKYKAKISEILTLRNMEVNINSNINSNKQMEDVLDDIITGEHKELTETERQIDELLRED